MFTQAPQTENQSMEPYWTRLGQTSQMKRTYPNQQFMDFSYLVILSRRWDSQTRGQLVGFAATQCSQESSSSSHYSESKVGGADNHSPRYAAARPPGRTPLHDFLQSYPSMLPRSPS